MPDHTCPHGLSSKEPLERQAVTVDNPHLTSREGIDAFKVEHGVKMPPQTFAGVDRIGGCDVLRAHFGKAESGGVSCAAIGELFSVATPLAPAVVWVALPSITVRQKLGWFLSIPGVLL